MSVGLRVYKGSGFLRVWGVGFRLLGFRGLGLTGFRVYGF